jgi:hypothetical protein
MSPLVSQLTRKEEFHFSWLLNHTSQKRDVWGGYWRSLKMREGNEKTRTFGLQPGTAKGAVAVGAVGIGAVAVGALAVGAVAVGALAVGAVAVRALAIHRGRIDRLFIGELTVERLIIKETQGKD